MKRSMDKPVRKQALIEVYNPIKKSCEWLPGYVTGSVCGDVGEDFERLNVILDDDRSFNGVHPSCVKYL